MSVPEAYEVGAGCSCLRVYLDEVWHPLDVFEESLVAEDITGGLAVEELSFGIHRRLVPCQRGAFNIDECETAEIIREAIIIV